MVERADDGVELTYNLSEPRNHSYVVDGVVVRNCCEYMHLDNSACNLASLNLMTFLDDDDTFDVEGFRAGVEVIFTAQEILVGNADYPTEQDRRELAPVPRARHRLRQPRRTAHGPGSPLRLRRRSGLGGGHHRPHDGPRLRHLGPTAARMGPFAGYHDNADP